MNAREYLKKYSSRAKSDTISIEEMWHMRLIDLCKYMESYHQQRSKEEAEELKEILYPIFLRALNAITDKKFRIIHAEEYSDEAIEALRIASGKEER